MTLRILAGLLAAFYAVNAAMMVLFPSNWYATAAGVRETGPFNPHFVIDIGLIYLTCAACLALWSMRPSIGSAFPKIAAVWPAMHAAFHLYHWTHGLPQGAALWTEFFGVVGAAILGLWIAWRAGVEERRA